MDDKQIWKEMTQLESKLDVRELEYDRYFNAVEGNGRRTVKLDDFDNTQSPHNPNWAYSDEEDILPAPSLNMLSAVEETICSKMSQIEVRTYITPYNATFRTYKTAHEMQQFLDIFTEHDDLYKKHRAVFRDCARLGLGVEWIDDEAKSVKRVLPSQFYLDPSELFYGSPTRCSLKFKKYPLHFIKDKIKKSSFAAEYEADRTVRKTYRVYWDLVEKKKYEFVESEMIKVTKISYDIPPFAWIFYKEPMRGLSGKGLTAGNWWLQQKINSLGDKLNKATELNAAQRTWVPDGTDEDYISASNRVGSILTYPSNGGGTGVIVETPPPIDPMYQSLLEWYYEMGFRGEGVSQLSAQSKLPGAADQSGKALDTMQDIESERFNTQVKNYIDFQQRVIEVMFEVFPEDDDILPADYNHADIKWKDMKANLKDYKITLGQASAMSKDPSRQLEQIMVYIKMGLLNPSVAGKFLTDPDLQGAQSLMTAENNYIEKIIENAALNKEYDFYEAVNPNDLYKAIQQRIMMLATVGSDEDEEIIENLKNLMNKVKAIMDQFNAIVAEEAAKAQAMKGVPQQNVPQPGVPGASLPPNQVPVVPQA